MSATTGSVVRPETVARPRPAIRPIRVVMYVVLVLFAIFYLTPVYILLITGLKSFQEVNLEHMWAFPHTFSLQSFYDALFGSEASAMAGIAPNFINSFEMTIPATLLSALLGSLNGYVLSKWKFKGSNVLFPLILFGLFIPYQAILIPLTRTMLALGLYGTIPGLIFAHTVYGIPICTLIFRNYYATVPGEMIEASRIDGAGFFGVYRYIVLPLSLPGFIVVAIWQFTSIWNDFLFGVILSPNPSTKPVMVAVFNLAGAYSVQWNIQMAGALAAALPTLLVYILLSRYFVRGLLAGSLKG
jgi:glucose/mannose transport system permease protein